MEGGEGRRAGWDPPTTSQNPARRTLLLCLFPSCAYLQKQVAMERARTAQKQWQLQQVGPHPEEHVPFLPLRHCMGSVICLKDLCPPLPS